MSEHIYTLNEKIGSVKYALAEKSYITAAANLGIPYATLKFWIDKYGDFVTDNKYKTNEEIEIAVKANAKKRGPKPGSRQTYKPIGKNELGEDGLLMIDRWRSLRKRKGFSVDDLARASGIGRATINNTAGCHNPPSKKAVPKIAAALGVSVNHLLYGTKEGAPVDLVAEPETPKTAPEKRANLSDRINALNNPAMQFTGEVICPVDTIVIDNSTLPPVPTPTIHINEPQDNVITGEQHKDLLSKIFELKEEVTHLRTQLNEMQDHQLKLMNLSIDIMQTQQDQARQYIAFKSKAPGNFAPYSANNNGGAPYKNDNYGNTIGDQFNKDFTKKG